MKHVPRDDHCGAGECGHGVSSPCRTVGISLTSRSRRRPPPIPVSIPRIAATSGSSPNASAFSVPETANSPRPAASKSKMGVRSRSRRGCPEGQHRRAQRNRDVLPATERRRWSRAEQDIPEHPAGIASDKGKNTDPEDIETVFHADCRTADGEHRRAGKVQCVPHRAHREVSQARRLARSSRSSAQLFSAIDSGED